MRLITVALVFISISVSFAQPGKVSGCKLRKSELDLHRSVFAQNSISDTFDILNYRIELNITDFTTKVIRGNCEVKFVALQNNLSVLPLDLLRLTVDSIKQNNSLLTYTYNDTLLNVTIPVMSQGDTSTVKVYYKGVPSGDPSGWGGFYYQSGYAFNLGVGFGADPHNYGRVWFPCFDNFVERSTYDFVISTNGGKVAYCNGLLISDTTDTAGLRTRTWKMSQEIPTYLASVAVANYTNVTWRYQGMLGSIPMLLTALPADTTNLKNSFVNLPDAMEAFEDKFGPYRWDRVGFVLVPFSSGAMEHATNIAFPKVAANGTLAYEADLMAHELAHHWWGDLATCRTQEDMWLNEGMASYSEYTFTEHVYGQQAYKNAVRANHEEVIHYLHYREGGYRAVSGVPHAYTYGDHVYLKGADVAHTLRGYMGDSLFFKGLKAYLDTFRYKDASSYDFRDVLNASTGLNLNDFFTNWVFNPGFPHFSVDSMQVVANGGTYDVTVYVKQKLTGTSTYYMNVPLQLSFKNSVFAQINKRIVVSGPTSSFTFNLPFRPVYAGLNLDEKISDATAPEMKVIKATGVNNFPNARMNLTVRSVADSVYLKIDHNFTAPDPFKVNTGQFRISPNRYWKVDGVFRPGFDASAKIFYDGRGMTSGGNGCLDNALITTTEDSVVLLYRKNTADDWQLCNSYTKNMLVNVSDKYGSITIDTLKQGEYVLGMLRFPVEVLTNDANIRELTVYPNPGNSGFEIINPFETTGSVEVTDSNGRKVHFAKVPSKKGSTFVDASSLANGIYFVTVRDGAGKVATTRWVKQSQ